MVLVLTRISVADVIIASGFRWYEGSKEVNPTNTSLVVPPGDHS